MDKRIYSNIAECIGNTPIVEVQNSLVPEGKRLWVKLESYNPSFSIKDRTALGLVKAAMASGKLLPGGTLIESTSGNLGKSLAMLGAVYGFHVIVVIDAKTSSTVTRWCEAYGAQMEMVLETDEKGGYQKTRVARVKKLLEQHPEAVWLNQYDNEDNPCFHYATTGEEVAAVEADVVVGSVSTGGASLRHRAQDQGEAATNNRAGVRYRGISGVRRPLAFLPGQWSGIELAQQ